MNLKTKITNSFSGKANNYAASAIMQKNIAEELILYSSEQIKTSGNILDIGCGTGFIAEIIKKDFNKGITQSDISPEMCRIASAYGITICCDFDKLPFPENSFDLLISSCALQWSPDLNKTFSGFNNILKDKGFLAFTIFGKKTFDELNSLSAKLNIASAVNRFLSLEEIESALKNSNFKNIRTQTKLITENISLKELFKKMKDIGANISNTETKIKKSDYKTLYENYKNNISWEVYYIIAEKI